MVNAGLWEKRYEGGRGPQECRADWARARRPHCLPLWARFPALIPPIRPLACRAGGGQEGVDAHNHVAQSPPLRGTPPVQCSPPVQRRQRRVPQAVVLRICVAAQPQACDEGVQRQEEAQESRHCQRQPAATPPQRGIDGPLVAVNATWPSGTHTHTPLSAGLWCETIVPHPSHLLPRPQAPRVTVHCP